MAESDEPAASAVPDAEPPAPEGDVPDADDLSRMSRALAHEREEHRQTRTRAAERLREVETERAKEHEELELLRQQVMDFTIAETKRIALADALSKVGTDFEIDVPALEVAAGKMAYDPASYRQDLESLIALAKRPRLAGFSGPFHGPPAANLTGNDRPPQRAPISGTVPPFRR